MYFYPNREMTGKEKKNFTLGRGTFLGRNALFYNFSILTFTIRVLLVLVDIYLHFFKYLFFSFPTSPDYIKTFPYVRF